MPVVERGDFWEFKARTAALDLELMRLRAQLSAVTQTRDALVVGFATRHGLDPDRPLVLEDTDCSVSQPVKRTDDSR